MRLLFLSNNYPPHALGGYEQWCQEVAISLAEQGHTLHVLTSRVGRTSSQQEDNVTVHRQLHLEVTGGLSETALRLLYNRPKLEAANLQITHTLIEEIQPDVALIWGMWNVPRNVPALVEGLLPGRVAYYFCDYWLTLPNAYIQRWQEPARSGAKVLQWAKQRLGDFFLAKLTAETAVSLRLEHPFCVSQAVCDLLTAAGLPVNHGRVIYGGTQVEQFLAPVKADHGSSGALRLLYVGRLVAEKGVYDTLVALRWLVEKGIAVTLDIYGQGDPDYTASLDHYVRQHGLETAVTFHGGVPRAVIPEILSRYDALLFPSIWPEPFARTVLEAMAAGLVVIGTTTGGTGEILQHGKTGLTFPSGNVQMLTEEIISLVEHPERRGQLARAGQERVLAEFTFDRMVKEIEAALTAVYHAPTLEEVP